MTEEITRVVDSQGNPATCCSRCGDVATSFANTSINLASSVPYRMEPVCNRHNLFKQTRDPHTIQGLRVPDIERDLAAMRAELSALRTLFATTAEAITRIDNNIATLLTNVVQCTVLQGGGEAPLGPPGRRCCSMYRRTTSSGAPPTDPAK